MCLEQWKSPVWGTLARQHQSESTFYLQVFFRFAKPAVFGFNRLQIIDRGVDAGSHFVECQLMGEEGEGSAPFKILGIFAT